MAKQGGILLKGGLGFIDENKENTKSDSCWRCKAIV